MENQTQTPATQGEELQPMKIRTLYIGPWANPESGFSAWKVVKAPRGFTHKELSSWFREVGSGDDADTSHARCLASNIGEGGVAWFRLDDETDVVVQMADL